MDGFEIDDDALASVVKLEGDFHPELTATQLAEKLLADAAPQAAMAVVALASKASSESMRYRAATYILDRILGKSQDGPSKANPWDELFSDAEIFTPTRN